MHSILSLIKGSIPPGFKHFFSNVANTRILLLKLCSAIMESREAMQENSIWIPGHIHHLLGDPIRLKQSQPFINEMLFPHGNPNITINCVNPLQPLFWNVSNSNKLRHITAANFRKLLKVNSGRLQLLWSNNLEFKVTFG